MNKPVNEITKYSNRKMYDKKNSKYVSLKDLHKMFFGMQENIRVIKQQNQKDITQEVIDKLILLELKNNPNKASKILEMLKHE